MNRTPPRGKNETSREGASNNELNVSDFTEGQLTTELRKFIKLRSAKRQILTKVIKALQNLIEPSEERNVDDIFPSETLVRTLKSKLLILTNTRKKLEELDTKIQSLLEEDLLMRDIEQSNERQESINEQLDIVNTIIESSRPEYGTDKRMNQAGENTECGNYKLPDLKLPRFDGNILNFQNFYENLTASIHEDSKLKSITKFQYLLSILDGKARNYVLGFKVEANSYQPALDRLIEEFDNKAKIVESHLLKIINLPTPQYNHAELSDFKSEIECHIRSLSSLKIIDMEEGPSIIQGTIIAQKLPQKVKSKVHWLKPKQNWNLDIVRTLLSNALKVLEDEPLITSHPKKTSANKSESHSSNPNKISSKSIGRSTFAISNSDYPNDDRNDPTLNQ